MAVNDDYNFLVNNVPEDFQFRPARGKVNQDGSVTVSGIQMLQQEIDNFGIAQTELVDVLTEIEKTIEARKTK